MENKKPGLVKYQTDQGEVKLSFDIVLNYLASGNPNLITKSELITFINLCKYQKLNPYLREAYIIKYSQNQPATIVVGKETFTKRATRDPDYNGFEAGIFIQDEEGKLEERNGSLALPGERIVGGWARVFKKNLEHPIYCSVSFDEYVGKKKNGEMNYSWVSKPATMIRKVALVQALREAYPLQLGGLYDSVEMNVDLDEAEKLRAQPRNVTPEETQQKQEDNSVFSQIVQIINKSEIPSNEKMEFMKQVNLLKQQGDESGMEGILEKLQKLQQEKENNLEESKE